MGKRGRRGTWLVVPLGEATVSTGSFGPISPFGCPYRGGIYEYVSALTACVPAFIARPRQNRCQGIMLSVPRVIVVTGSARLATQRRRAMACSHPSFSHLPF